VGIIPVGSPALGLFMIVQANMDSWVIAAKAILEGDLVAFPTDTVYGVGCDPYNVLAIEKVYRAKARSHLKALPLLLSAMTVMDKVCRVTNEQAHLLGRAFWPGALTIVVAKAANLPDELGSPTTIAVRVPDHADLRDFIERCGGAIAATSANISGEPDALDANQASAYLGRSVALTVDGGPVHGGVPSTVVDFTGALPVILRAGPIRAADIDRVLGLNGNGHG
jgi:tRNA threonylcarbamoyl adenosine modification protein (Sua5/YciO/YrdC/YwlC family)